MGEHMNYIFKFPTLGSAKFVVERLSQMGLKAAYMPSGYIRVEGMTEEAKQIISESLGTHVAATGVEDMNLPKYAGTGQGKKNLAPKTEDPKSAPTANPKTLKKHGNTSIAQTKGDIEEAVEPTEPVNDATKEEPNKASDSEDKISPEGKKLLMLQKLSYSVLKDAVSKNPSKYPKLSKIFGFKVANKK
jgi:hypothetical protein